MGLNGYLRYYLHVRRKDISGRLRIYIIFELRSKGERQDRRWRSIRCTFRAKL